MDHADVALPATTLRYYDRIGLLPATRLANNHRRYPESAIGRLQLIQLCRSLGCTLDEVAVVLRPGAGQRRRDLARAKLAEIEGRMAQLRGARSVLDHLADCEHGSDESEECRRATAAAWTTTMAATGAL